jgi:5-formyltetrahydrofolate cyclo-ligase
MDADAAALRAAKQVLRKAVRLRRDARDPVRRRRDDLARVEQIRGRLDDRPPPVVAGYLSTGSEPGTMPLVGWLAARGVRLLLPVLSDVDVRRTEPAWAGYGGPDALRIGARSILEPTTPVLPPEVITEAGLVICPGLAGTSRGDRLGRGGGWYDRVLGQVQAPAWVLLNDDEVLESLPVQAWDRRVAAIVTPTRFVDCR